MSESTAPDRSDPGRTATLTTIIPQQVTNVYEVALGLTPKEIALMAIPVAIELFLIIRFATPAEWQVWLIMGTAGIVLGGVRRAPDHLSPREVGVRSLTSLWARLRLPLTDDAARDVPGVVAVHEAEGAVERADGAQVAVLEVTPTNASQAGENERGQRALRLANALDAKLSKNNVPAKISVSRRLPDADAHVDGLREAGDDGHTHSRGERALAIDHANNALAQVAENGVRERRIFVATWVHPGEVDAGGVLAGTRFATVSEECRDEQTDLLERRVEQTAGAVAAVADADRLDTDEIVTVLRDYWTGSDGPAPSETAYTDSSLLPAAFAPSYVNPHARHAEVDDMVTASLWASGWPKYPNPGFLEPILNTEGVECDLTWFVGAADSKQKMKELGARAGKAAGEEGRNASEGDDAGAGDAARLGGDLLHLRDHMRDDGVDSSEVSFYVTLRAEDTAALSDARDALFDAAADSQVTLSPATGRTRQRAGLVSTSPVGGDRLFQAMRGWLDHLPDRGGLFAELPFLRTGTRTRIDMPPGAIGAMLPFTGGVRHDEGGVLYGMARSMSDDALDFLQIERGAPTAPHRFFVGESGSGKTFRVAVNLIEELIRNPARKAIILDIAQNFDGVVRLFGGEKVTLGRTPINPFQTSEGAHLGRQVTMLTNLFHIYLEANAREGTAESVRPLLSTAIREAFRRAGVETNSDEEVVAIERQTVMADLHDALEAMHDSPEDYAVRGTTTETEETRDHAGLLLSRLRPFTEGGEYGFMVVPKDNPEAAADLDARVVLYDMSDYRNADGAEKGMLTMLVLSRALSSAGAIDDYLNIVADEAHDLFRDAAQAGKFESAVRAGRNAGLAFDFISQAGEDFDEDTAKIIAGQCSVSVWGDLGEGHEDVPERFGWSASQAATINGSLATGDNAATDYSEAMVEVEGDRYLTRFEVGPVAQAVATYSEAEDGPWSEYLEQAIDRAAAAEQEMHNHASVTGGTDIEEGTNMHTQSTDSTGSEVRA